jgi:hypothetical protein
MAFNDEEDLNGLRLTQCKFAQFCRLYHLGKASRSIVEGEQTCFLTNEPLWQRIKDEISLESA